MFWVYVTTVPPTLLTITNLITAWLTKGPRRFWCLATIDAPACFYYQELLQAFRDVKVILTVREPQRWYRSFGMLVTRLTAFTR
jgi:Sulfotransferase domain